MRGLDMQPLHVSLGIMTPAASAPTVPQQCHNNAQQCYIVGTRHDQSGAVGAVNQARNPRPVISRAHKVVAQIDNEHFEVKADEQSITSTARLPDFGR
jgi:hypothetical protein